jgi:hypothetical protein
VADHVSPGSTPARSVGSSVDVLPCHQVRLHLFKHHIHIYNKVFVNNKKYTDGTIQYGMFKSICEPYKLLVALEDDRWCKAMKEEYNALM